MLAAARPRTNYERQLLVVDVAHSSVLHRRVSDLADALNPNDLLVVNDAATLPASLPIPSLDAELRLAQWGVREGDFSGVLFGAGDYHTPTELRPPPPQVSVGQVLEFGPGLDARIVKVRPDFPRFVDVRFNVTGGALFHALYRLGRPIQYSYVPEPLALWDVQNIYAGRPWAFEAPSAGFALDGRALRALQARNVNLAYITHGAGISSTGEPEFDRLFPLPERYEIPAGTAQIVNETRARGGRVVAVGTSVTRALESSADNNGSVVAGIAVTDLRLSRNFRRAVVDGILSGMHEPETSHFQLLEAFAGSTLLHRAARRAEELGYLGHEFGDACLILSPLAGSTIAAVA